VKFKPIVPRALANWDVDEAIKHYLDQQAGSAALGFIDALEHENDHISSHRVTALRTRF
jgi:toxin ParE1/3/4